MQMVKNITDRSKPYAVQPISHSPSPEADKLFAKTVRKQTQRLARSGKPKLTTEVRLVIGSLTKNCCKDRSSGFLCGSVYEEITRDEIGRIVKSVCYPNKHVRKSKTRKGKVA